MRLKVHKDRCTICEPSIVGWIVSDRRGATLYYSSDWRKAVDYAYAATQPGTGVQVQVMKRGSNQ